MEKDSFENQLLQKVLQAEAALRQNSDKEKVWKMVQNEQPKHKLYYSAAVVIFIIGMVATIYFKSDQPNNSIVETKPREKPVDLNFQKPQVLKKNVTERQAGVTIKSPKAKRLTEAKPQLFSALPKNADVPAQTLAIVIPPVADEKAINVVKGDKAEIAIVLIPEPPVVAEFTVQFKRGKPTGQVENQTKDAIARLKRFKLSRDTSIIANNDKQKSIFRIKF